MKTSHALTLSQLWSRIQVALIMLRGRAAVARRAHNPEVSGSNPLPATKREPETNNLRFFVSPEEFGYKIFFLGGFCNEPETVGFDHAIE